MRASWATSSTQMGLLSLPPDLLSGSKQELPRRTGEGRHVSLPVSNELGVQEPLVLLL